MDKVDGWRYTAVLDENTCENCAPYHGLVASIDEWIEEGMNISTTGDKLGPLNPNCLGGVKCWCQLEPAYPERKDDELF